jgi:serine/threonine protein kinase
MSVADVKSAFAGLPQGKVVLAACQPEEAASEDPAGGHGLFTDHLLAGLLGDAANEAGEITVLSLYDYIARLMGPAMGQTATFRGDLAGSLVLGRGFEPVERMPPDPGRIRDLRETGDSLLNEFQQRVGPAFSDRTIWARKGHMLASHHLATLVSWFERRRVECPEIAGDREFRSRLSEVQMWRSRLSDLEGVVETSAGTVLDRIGSGTFGTVWKLARARATSDMVAYKVFHGQDLPLRDKLTRFRHGYEAMQRLNHPHVVKVMEYTDCPVGFTMDFIDGPNLRDLARLDNPRDALALLLVIGETLAHAHDRGVVHRDVKPENILVKYEDPDWKAYLTDFDLAWFSTATAVTREAIGSAYYAAPEQVYKPTSSSARMPTVDVYAFGQLCFYALTGSDPVPQVADNLRALEVQLGKWSGADVASAILRLYDRSTRFRPEERTTTIREVCDALHHIIMICGGKPDDTITEERFLRELAFALTGLSRSAQPDAFSSISGKTRLTTQLRRQASGTRGNLSVGFERLAGTLTLPGLDHSTARKRLNARVDEALQAFKSVRRRSGSSGTYTLHVDAFDVDLSLAGVEATRRIMSRVIAVIERE